MNCVVVGYGFSGKSFHCYLIKHITNSLRLYGVVSRRPEQRELIIKEQECKVFERVEDCLSDPLVHVVVVASSNNTHAPIALQALKAKKHVVVEKPFALNVADALELERVAKENNVLLTVFQNRRWDGDFLTLQKLVKENKLGNQLHWIEMSWRKYGITSAKPWKQDTTTNGGGRFWDFASHLLDQLLILTSPARITSIYCTISYTFPTIPDTDTHALLVLKFNTSLTAVINTSSHTFHDKPHFLVCGESATYVREGFDPQENAMIKGDIEAYPVGEMGVGVLKNVGGSEVVSQVRGEWWRFYANLGDALEGKSELVVKPEEVIRVLRVIELALLSAKSGKVIETDL